MELTKEVRNLLQTEPLLKNRVGLITYGGSLAYGTNLPRKSDIDTRGFAFEPAEQLIGGVENFATFVDAASDTVFYSFNKLLKLLLENNPNTLEILGCKSEHYFYLSSVGRKLVENVDKFLSQRVFFTFGGYAKMLLERMESAMAQGSLEEQKLTEHMQGSLERTIYSFNEKYTSSGFGSIKVRIIDSEGLDQAKELVLDLAMNGYPLEQVAGMLSELSNIKRMYTKVSKRITRKDDEHLDKHAMHIIRLLCTGNELVTTGKMHTYREKEHDMLMDIRKGTYRNTDGTYNSAFYDLKDELVKQFEYGKEHTVLSEKPNSEWVREFQFEVNKRIITGELDTLNL